jgi:hypothetical protein
LPEGLGKRKRELDEEVQQEGYWMDAARDSLAIVDA